MPEYINANEDGGFQIRKKIDAAIIFYKKRNPMSSGILAAIGFLTKGYEKQITLVSRT